MARFEFSRFEYRIKLFIIAFIDLLIGLSVYKFAFYLRSLTGFGIFRDIMPEFRFWQVPHYTVFLGFTQLALLYFFRFYDADYVHFPRKSLLNLSKVVILHILVLISYYFFRQDVSLAFPRSIFPVFGILNLLCLYAWRAFIHKLFFKRHKKRRVLVVGANRQVKDLIIEIERLPGKVLEIVGVLTSPDDLKANVFMGYPILGSYTDVVHIASDYHVDEVILTPSSSWQELVVNDFIASPQVEARVSILPSPYEILIGRISHLRVQDIPLIEILKENETPVERAGKRIFDLFFAVTFFVITIPVSILITIGIWITSGGPAIYRQIRVGKNGKQFEMLKFRTMVNNAEQLTGPVWSSKDDPRITRFGRWLRRSRLDEIPQLINIIKGDMSFVGPRPERPYFVERFVKEIPAFKERFKVKPGLTGLAQVNGDYDTTPENKLKYDLAYMYNKSILLDLRILLETIKVVLAGGGEPLRESNGNFNGTPKQSQENQHELVDSKK